VSVKVTNRPVSDDRNMLDECHFGLRHLREFGALTFSRDSDMTIEDWFRELVEET